MGGDDFVGEDLKEGVDARLGLELLRVIRAIEFISVVVSIFPSSRD
jgi:hypothetical protein